MTREQLEHVIRAAAQIVGASETEPNESCTAVVRELSDLREYIEKRKKRDLAFAENFELDYEKFKLGAVLLRQAREEAGLTQEEVASRMATRKSAISRIENRAEDIKLSTLERFAEEVGRRIPNS